MVIPTYWTRTSDFGWTEGDAVYDHPTPLDQDGTLFRALESIQVLKDRDFELVVIVVPTCPDIALQAEARVTEMVADAKAAGVSAHVLGPSRLRRFHQVLTKVGREKDCELLQLQGYSNIRNLCLFAAHIFSSDIAVLIDDDEVFEDPEYMNKAKEFIGTDSGGQVVHAVAGYYLQADGSFRVVKPHRPWMEYWDPHRQMNLAFEQTIATEPRLKKTPFVFGGNMVVDRDLFMKIPFDPAVTRGEDIDFLMSAKMFGFDFFLDNQLTIKHLAPPKTHPLWRQFREDIHRFLYERAKLESQVDRPGMRRISAADLEPYPGNFLESDLENKIVCASRLLADEYTAEGDKLGAEQALANAGITIENVFDADPFLHLCALQKRWSALMSYVDQPEAYKQLQEALIT